MLNLAHLHVTDEGVRGLRRLTNLEELHLDSTAIDDDGIVALKSLTNLMWLDVSDTAITDIGLGTLKALKKLTVLRIARTRCTARAIEGLKSALPACDVESSDINLSNLSPTAISTVRCPQELVEHSKTTVQIYGVVGGIVMKLTRHK